MKLKREGTPKQDINMKKLFRRNQIIITTLAIMIAAAGYLNYAGKRDLAASTGEDIYQAGTFDISEEDLLAENQKKGQEDTAMIEEAQPQAEGTKLQAEASQDGSFLAEADAGTDQAVIDSWDGGEEAGMENPGEAVLTSGLTVSDYIAGVQLNREQIRARNKETLNSIINSTNIDEAAKQEAIQNMIAMTAVAEKENAAETLLQARGFADPVVSLTDGKVDVVIHAPSITDQQRAQIEDIVKRKTGVAAESIVITPLSQSKNASDVINTADEAEKNTGGAEDNAESTGDEVQDTAASVESDPTDQTSEDAETAADIQNDQTIDTEGIYD